MDDFVDFLVENDYIESERSEDWRKYDLNELPEMINNAEFYVCGYRDSYDVIAPNTLFLTKDSCKKHIERNGYHYKKPHTYAMTAWRSPEVERLWKILEETDWRSLL